LELAPGARSPRAFDPGAHVKKVTTPLTWLGLALSLLCGHVGQGHAEETKQNVLGPGLYVFQTRIREASCGDAEPDGYVLSYVAAIDGVPGSMGMSMQLVNTSHFAQWTLQVTGTGAVVGDSRMGKAADAPDSHFEVTRDGDRFKGTGFRSYNGSVGGKPQRCKVSYDALLKRIDL
jgi:hypothetical protein